MGVFSFSGSALFIKTRNHVHAPYQNSPVYILFLLKSSNILTNLIASKYTSICIQGSGNAKTWPYYMYKIKLCPKCLILGPGLTLMRKHVKPYFTYIFL